MLCEERFDLLFRCALLAVNHSITAGVLVDAAANHDSARFRSMMEENAKAADAVAKARIDLQEHERKHGCAERQLGTVRAVGS